MGSIELSEMCRHPKEKVYENENSVFMKCLIGHEEKDRLGRVKGIGFPVFLVRKEQDKQKVII